jgi:hypothetical protein
MWRIPLVIVGLYFVGRAVAEPFVIDASDPATYARDWGGPHLSGILAVHCGPGLVAAALFAVWIRRRQSRRPV